MKLAYLINIIGLCFDIVGIILIFWFGIPDGKQLNKEGLHTQAWPTFHPEVKAEWEKYNFWSKFGLGLAILGFLFQLCSTIIQGVN